MNNLRHPSELNPLQLYQQAKRVAKRTSRAKNPDWYAEPFAVQRQWHLWVDGGGVASALFDRQAKRWAEGPSLPWLERGHEAEESAPDADLSGGRGITGTDLEELHSALAEALRSRELGGKVKSLGVVLHVADEFAILDPAREYSSNADFDGVQALLLENPKEVLGDSTVDPLLHTWRLLPNWGVKEGRLSMAVQMGRHREDFFSAVRAYGEDNNLAIRATGVSAPLETLRLAPLYLEWEQGRGDIIVMVYRLFSALAVLNGDGELMQLRSLNHRAGMEYPAGLGEILVNTQTSEGLENPVVTILPMNQGTAQEDLTRDLTNFFARREPMDIGFNKLNEMDALKAIPKSRIEMLLGDRDSLEALLEGGTLEGKATFAGLASGWATQDFFPLSQMEEEKFPSWKELQLRKWFGVVKLVLVLAVAALGIWGGAKVVETLPTEAWRAPELDPAAASMGMAKLKKEEKELDYWQAIMEKRSQGWLVMELLLELFPEDSGVVMADCDYIIGSARVFAGGQSKGATGMGFTRKWKITGFAKPQAANYLNNLSSSAFIRNQFESLAKKYDADEFRMGVKGRTINVTLQRDQRAYPPSGVLGKDAEGFTLSFTLEITQVFSAEDELAVPIATVK
jgi:hypothetical protein